MNSCVFLPHYPSPITDPHRYHKYSTRHDIRWCVTLGDNAPDKTMWFVLLSTHDSELFGDFIGAGN
ncbi:hypothetical protein [Nostoc sp. PA-18-2419]|uniref:hypothetical protein n=1 Tax=Nostoc sp. PA-18-2419 TaxID=2575443 RepID=UPI00110929FF|nr:hypothetical protein [Nostoc sp. PA-18-2419]